MFRTFNIGGFGGNNSSNQSDSPNENRTNAIASTEPTPSATISHVSFNFKNDVTAANSVPTADVTDGMIAEQMARLSRMDLEKIQHGIHGVADVISEEPVFVEEKLLEFQEALNQITEKPAYYMAYQANAKYVTNKDFVLSFLRADRFDPALAAIRMTRHFHAKLELFGKNSLGRDLTQEDLDAEDREGLYSGLIQRLPQRDRSGRSIFVSFAHPRHAAMKARSKAKWYFYFSYTLLKDDVESQRNGIIGIAYQVGHSHFDESSESATTASLKDFVWESDDDIADQTESSMNESLANDSEEAKDHLGEDVTNEMKKSFWNVTQLVLTLPMRCEAFHVCYDSIVWKAMIAIYQFAFDNFLRLRVRSHYGSHQECLYQLMTFGIPSVAFPIQYQNQIGGLLNGPSAKSIILTDRHVKELREIREKERQVTVSNPGGFWKGNHFIALPNPQDVLFGRGQRTNQHPGNRYFQELVRSKMEAYEKASKREKTQMAKDITHAIKEMKGGRFLKSSTNAGWVEEEEELEIRRKIASCFRSVRKANAANQMMKKKSLGNHSEEVKAQPCIPQGGAFCC